MRKTQLPASTALRSRLPHHPCPSVLRCSILTWRVMAGAETLPTVFVLSSIAAAATLLSVIWLGWKHPGEARLGTARC